MEKGQVIHLVCPRCEIRNGKICGEHFLHGGTPIVTITCDLWFVVKKSH